MDKKKGLLAARSVHHIFTTLNTALREARVDGYIATIPCELMKAPRAPRKEMTALDGTGARLILSAFKGSEIEPIVVAALGTGLRRGELLGLRWGDVDLDASTITIQRSLERVSGVTRFKEPKTPRSRRTVVMPKFVVQSMQTHRLAQAQRLLALGFGRPTEKTIVFDRLGEPWNPATFSSIFYRSVKRLKASVRFHDLRHSFASIALSAGTDLKAVSDALGHSAISTTADLYAHLFASVQREAAARMDAAIGQNGGSRKR
jgi:integrase